MNERVADVAQAIIEAIRGALVAKGVTESEYRQGVMYMMKVAESKEMGLLCDVFLNSTIIAVKAAKTKGSMPAIQGPYFREEAPFVEGRLRTYETDDHRPLVVQGTVKDDAGRPIPNVVLDIWHSTPDGKYSGFHDNIPLDYYRGKIKTDSSGNYKVQTTMPVPYQIPNKGPTGALLEMMGSHSWRPAHVHFKVRKDGFEPLTTQYYFAGGDWVDSDCCNGVNKDLIHPNVIEDGVQKMNIDFVLETAAA